MQTLEQFGQTIKAKYPQYNDINDTELGQKMLEKYPEYKDMVDTSTPTPSAPPTPTQPGVFQKIGSSLNESFKQIGQTAVGVGKGYLSTAENIGQLGQSALNQTFGRVVNKVTGKGNTPVQNSTVIPKQAITPTDAQKPGFVGEKVSEFLIPGGAEEKVGQSVGKLLENFPKAVKVVGELGAKATTSAATTAGITAAQGGSGNDVKTAGAIGAGASLVGGGIGKILSSLPENAWSTILKRTSSQVAKNPNLPAQAADTGMVGTKTGIAKQAGEQIQHLEVKLGDLLKPIKGTVDGGKVAAYLGDLKNTYSAVPGEAHAVGVIDQLQQDIAGKGQLPYIDALHLKQDIYSIIQKSYGKGTLEIPAKIEGQKILAAGIKKEIEKAVPESKAITEKQAIYIQIKKAIDRQLSLGEGRGVAGLHIGMHDLLTGGVAELAGLSTGHPLAGAVTLAGKKAIESTLFQSTAAKVADYFNNLSPTQKALFYNGLKGLTTNSVSSSK